MKSFNIQLFASESIEGYEDIYIDNQVVQAYFYTAQDTWQDFISNNPDFSISAQDNILCYNNDPLYSINKQAWLDTTQTIPLDITHYASNSVYLSTTATITNSVVIYSNDGQIQLAYAENVQSIDVTSTGATFTYITTGSPADYTYSSVGNTFNGFATQANSSTPTYSIGDTITVSSALPVNNNVLSLYCVEIVGTLYKHLLKDGDKIQVDSAIRDGNGVKIDTNYEKVANKVTSISNSSTDTQYPSAKCTYDYAQEVTILTTEPTSANTSGRYKLVKLTSEPATRYDGYIYFIISSNSQ